jgi:phage terminase small subunit
MPQLKNLRRETFCQMIFEGKRFGWSQGTCYMKAGYRTTGHGAEVNAGRLLKNADIRARLVELGGNGVRRAKLTADSLIDKLDVVFDGSVQEKQYSAAGRAVETQGKLAGLMVNRHEVGAPGDFANCESTEEVLELVKEELGPETAALLAEALSRGEVPASIRIDYHAAALLNHGTIEQAQEALLRLASSRAVVVDHAPLAPRRSNEAAEGLALFRPTYKAYRS